MKTKTILPLLSLALGLTFSLPTGTALAQGTAFTYQGRLDSGGTPYTGNAEFQATLWTAATGGTQVAANTPTSLVVGVTNGLFTLPLDFGANFPGADRWLQLEVRTSIGAFTTLSPRQPLTPTPYALHASQVNAAGVVGTLSSGQLGGTYSAAVTFNNAGNVFSGNGSGLTGVNAASVGGVSGANLWKLNGNSGVGSGQFLGTTDNQPLELRVNGLRALRLEPNTNGQPNVIAGASENTVAAGVYGATIGGGWVNTIQAGATQSTIGGGGKNKVQPSSRFATIGGGFDNTIQTDADNTTIGGGGANTIQDNTYASTIGGGEKNTIQTGATTSTIGGGYWNTVQSSTRYATIGGGNLNTIRTNAWNATIGGGYGNDILPNATNATIGGGVVNVIGDGAYGATIPGGIDNRADAKNSFAAGYRAKANHQGAFVWADSQNEDFSSTGTDQFAVRAQGGVMLVGNVKIGNGTYQNLEMTGGNSSGYLFGSYPKFQDGLHLAYNYYADAAGGDHVINPGGGTSRVTVGYGAVSLVVGGVNNVPDTKRLVANSSGVTVYGTFNNSSDRNEKQDFAPVDAEAVLAGVAALPVSRWSYKTDPGTRHLGPMAQDFYAQFQVGTDDKHIAPLDEGGVALVAIQALNRKLETEAAALRTENAQLKARLERLERLLIVTQMPNGE